MNWISLLGLDALSARWRAALNETAIAAEDRANLAQLEWHEHKHNLKALVLLLIALGGLTVVVLSMLSLALMVHFWDSEYRITVAWSLAGGWLLVWVLALWRLLAAARRLAQPFKLTRHEFKADWKALKEKL